MQRRINPRDAKRMMQRMGMNMEGVEDVEEVIIRTPSKEIVIESPEVAIVNMQGQKIFQVAGGKVSERTPERKAAAPKVSEEDVQLVAGQTGKRIEEARKAEGIYFKAAILLKMIATTRIFQDGHHRTAYITTKTFLEKNDATFKEKDERKIIKFIKDIRKYDIEQVKDWLENG